ncbi:MAG: ComF family protein [Lysobacter sp.]
MMAQGICAQLQRGVDGRDDSISLAANAAARGDVIGTSADRWMASGFGLAHNADASFGEPGGDPAASSPDSEPTRRTASPVAATTVGSTPSPIVAPAVAPIIVPIPLHRTRLRERGYDQALELARPLSRELGLPLLTDALIRERNTPPQSRLDAAHRRRNLRDAFVWRSAWTAPAHVVLIDDVMTTGATLHAAARTLRRAGVKRVDAWVCARVL